MILKNGLPKLSTGIKRMNPGGRRSKAAPIRNITKNNMNQSNAIEKSGGKSFFSFLKPKKQDIVKSITRGEFEKNLFSGGVYHFDFDRDVRELEMDVMRTKAWYDSNPHWDEKRTADSMARDIDDARYELTWRNQFSGQIPRNWVNWITISDDFEAAGKLGLQLSDELINAGITHPHHLVANTVGKSQRLNMTQLIAALARPGIPSWNEREIIDAQITKGLTQKELGEAQRRANEIKEKIRQEKKGKPQLRNPLPELTKGDK